MIILGKESNKGFTTSELLVVFAIVFFAGTILWPVVRYNHDKMDRIVCENNVQKTVLALYIYALEHEGKFPASIEVLYQDEYLSDRELMKCPANERTETGEDSDYIYTAGLSVKGSSKDILLRDKKKNHPGGGRNVAYVNGSILWEIER